MLDVKGRQRRIHFAPNDSIHSDDFFTFPGHGPVRALVHLASRISNLPNYRVLACLKDSLPIYSPAHTAYSGLFRCRDFWPLGRCVCQFINARLELCGRTKPITLGLFMQKNLNYRADSRSEGNGSCVCWHGLRLPLLLCCRACLAISKRSAFLTNKSQVSANRPRSFRINQA